MATALRTPKYAAPIFGIRGSGDNPDVVGLFSSPRIDKDVSVDAIVTNIQIGTFTGGTFGGEWLQVNVTAGKNKGQKRWVLAKEVSDQQGGQNLLGENVFPPAPKKGDAPVNNPKNDDLVNNPDGTFSGTVEIIKEYQPKTKKVPVWLWAALAVLLGACGYGIYRITK